MKPRKYISGLLSFILSVALLSGSTGFTIIKHSCKSHSDFSISSESLFTSSKNTVNCCNISEKPVPAETHKLAGKGCCDYKVKQFSINNFLPSQPEYFTSVLTFRYNNDILVPDGLLVKNTKPVEIFNKHGGRYITISNCQFLS
ncbi:MAG: hypothetical protein C0408_01780 [Odoribacter sp.]|nr:hypothetical protein [Odoribacter sp.]